MTWHSGSCLETSFTDPFLSTLVQVEEKLEGGVQKKNLVRRVFARFCTPIFLEVCIYYQGLPLCEKTDLPLSVSLLMKGVAFNLMLYVLMDLCSPSF